MALITDYPRLARRLLLLLGLIGLACGWLTLNRGLVIETDLKSLSPALSDDPFITQTLDQLAETGSRQISLVLLHPDADTLDEASTELALHLAESPQLWQAQDPTEVLQSYLDYLAQQPFGLLTPQGQAWLETLDDEALLALARSRLYSSGGNPRLLPLERDPFGLANDYAWQALGALADAESGEAIELDHPDFADQPWYYAVHNLTLAPGALDMGRQGELLLALQNLEAELTADYPGSRFLHSGVFFFAADAASSAKRDISLISYGSLLGITLILLLVFRRPQALLLPALSIAGGSLFALLVCQALFGGIHILTIVFGASLIGVVVDYSLHLFYFRARQERDHQALYRALALSLITSLIGYSALAWSGLDALRQVAVFSGVGLVFAWLLVVAVGPWLASGLKLKDGWLDKGLGAVMAASGRLSGGTWLAALALVALLLAAAGGFEIPADDSPRAFFSPSPQRLAEEQLLNPLLNRQEPGSFLRLEADRPSVIYAQIQRLGELVPTAEKQPLLGVQLFFPSPGDAARAYALNQRLYGPEGLALKFMQSQGFTPEAINQLAEDYRQVTDPWLSPTAFFAPEPEDLQKASALPPFWQTQNGKISSFLLIPRGTDTRELAALVEPLPGVRFISLVDENRTALGELRRSALWLLALALVLVAGLLLARFRQLGQVIRLMLVPLGSLGCTLLLLSALGHSLTLFHVMALFLVLGLGMDYVIFVTEMAHEARASLAAITLSTATSLLAFGLLSASSLPAVSGFGLTVLIGSSCNLLGALLLASRHLFKETSP